MKNNSNLLPAILALLLALALIIQVSCEKRKFDRTVENAYKTSEGYDKKLIEIVDKLEEVLATRARFGYMGGKDPMTGRVRLVAKRVKLKRKTSLQRKKTGNPFRLTATFLDEQTGKYTAIIMYGERSFSVEVGDVIRGRKIRKINSKSVLMENSTHRYLYKISGGVRVRKKGRI